MLGMNHFVELRPTSDDVIGGGLKETSLLGISNEIKLLKFDDKTMDTMCNDRDKKPINHKKVTQKSLKFVPFYQQNDCKFSPEEQASAMAICRADVHMEVRHISSSHIRKRRLC